VEATLSRSLHTVWQLPEPERASKRARNGECRNVMAGGHGSGNTGTQKGILANLRIHSVNFMERHILKKKLWLDPDDTVETGSGTICS